MVVEKNKITTARRLTVFVLGALGTVYFGLVAQLFLFGIDEWETLGVTVKLRPWWKPLWIGTAFWLLMLTAARQSPRPFKLVKRRFDAAGQACGFPLSRPGADWAVPGGFIGAALAFFFSEHFYYLLPAAAFRIGSVILGLLVSALLHFGFFHLFERGIPRLFPGVSGFRVTTTRIGFYITAWAALLTWPLKSWEAMGTEPFFSNLIPAVITGLFLSWVFMAGWDLKGGLGLARRAAVPAVILAALALGLFTWRTDRRKLSPDEPLRDRVILITIDTTRSDFLSCYGYPRKTSPNLDALAASGARFTMAFCPRGETDPSHASVLTGTYPRTHGLLTNFMRVTGSVASMAEVFRDNGYATLSITSRSHLHPGLMNIPGFTDISAPSLSAQSTSAFDAYRRFHNKLLEYRDKNIFVWLHFFDPHASYKPHPGYSDQFIEEDRGAYVGRGKKTLKPGERIPASEIKYARDLYAGEVFYMDYWIGQCVELARDLSPRPTREPFILVIADHGESLGDYQDHPARYGFGHGGVLYNASAHVPLIVSWPDRIPVGAVIREPVESVDVAPTMLDYCLDHKGFPNQGMSLRPVIQAGAPSDNLAISQRPANFNAKSPYYNFNQWAVIRDNYKLIIGDNGDTELYDLERDWEEKVDISKQNAALIEEFSADLQDWLSVTPEAEVKETRRTKAEINVLKALGYIQ
jgi:arylsulfatase A-like enzyme